MNFRTVLIGGGLLCMAFAAPAVAADIDNGRQVYETYCMSCHGADARLWMVL